MKSKATELLRLITQESGLVLRPCAYDALSALMIEQAGFRVIGTTGYGISAAAIGQPDIGLLGFAEILERARTIINAVDSPVDVDIDTGYGNAMNVYWTVQNMIRIGAAGVRFEDQLWPKRCGHMVGKGIIEAEDMVTKIKAAVLARNDEDSDIVVGARTDARSIHGFEEALNRAILYGEAGADYVYIEAPQSLAEIKKLVEQVPVPIALNVVPGGKTPPYSLDDLEKCGVRFLSIPMICLYPAIKAMKESLAELAGSRDLHKIASMGVDWSECNDIVGFKKWRQRELEVLDEAELIQMYGAKDFKQIEAIEQEGVKIWK